MCDLEHLFNFVFIHSVNKLSVTYIYGLHIKCLFQLNRGVHYGLQWQLCCHFKTYIYQQEPARQRKSKIITRNRIGIPGKHISPLIVGKNQSWMNFHIFSSALIWKMSHIHATLIGSHLPSHECCDAEYRSSLYFYFIWYHFDKLFSSNFLLFTNIQLFIVCVYIVHYSFSYINPFHTSFVSLFLLFIVFHFQIRFSSFISLICWLCKKLCPVSPI